VILLKYFIVLKFTITKQNNINFFQIVLIFYINYFNKIINLYFIIMKSPITMQNNNDYFDWVIKIVFVGDSGVGKTNIILKYC